MKKHAVGYGRTSTPREDRHVYLAGKRSRNATPNSQIAADLTNLSALAYLLEKFLDD